MRDFTMFKRIAAVFFAAVLFVSLVSMGDMQTAYASSSGTARVARVTGLRANPGNNGRVRLSWNRVRHARRYEVFRATSRNGRYRRIATVRGRTFTDRNRRAGRSYFYRVRAVRGTGRNRTFGRFSVRRRANMPRQMPSATPTPMPTLSPMPIIHREERLNIQDGTPIPFVMNLFSTFGTKYDSMTSRVITSREELLAWGEIQNSRYNDAFFRENVVIFCVFHEPQPAGAGVRVNTVLRRNNELFAEISMDRTQPSPAVLTTYLVAIEVKKADITGITRIHAFRHVIW